MIFSDEAIRAGKILSDQIISHPGFEAVVNQIESAVQLGNDAGIFSGVRLAAPSGSGKTTLMTYLSRRLQERYGHDGSIVIISGSLKENPSVSQIQVELLSNFNYALSGISRPASNNDVNVVLLKAIAQHRVRLIAIDEFQHVFLSGGTKMATVILDWVKRLMNLTNVPVVLIGTESMDRLEGVDAQLTTRIPTVARLGPLRLSGEWLAFLRGFVAHCSLIDLSPICEENVARRIYHATSGVPRMAKSLLIHAVCLGITTNQPRVCATLLKEAYRLQKGILPDEENPFALL